MLVQFGFDYDLADYKPITCVHILASLAPFTKCPAIEPVTPSYSEGFVVHVNGEHCDSDRS